MMRVRRHHLIEEAKAELDLAYNEVKRAETRIMELEFEFNERIKSQQNNGSDLAETQALNEEKERLQSDFDIEQLYEVQNEAVQRFARISSSFAIVGSIDDEKITVDLIKRLLFKDDSIRVHNLSIEKNIRTFQEGLREYMRKDSNQSNDRKVRENWAALEGMLEVASEAA